METIAKVAEQLEVNEILDRVEINKYFDIIMEEDIK